MESSEIQHVISKTFRDERRIATKSTIARGIFQRKATHVQGSDNNLYCMNRTSLENSFYATRNSIYTRRHGSYWKVIEGDGKSWKEMEAHRIIWKSLENTRTVHR